MRKNKYDAFTPLKLTEKELFTNWIDDINKHEVIPFKDDYLLTNKAAVDFVNKYTHLYLKKVGTNIGSVINKNVIPHHDLAWSIHKSQKIEAIECMEDEALKFFKKELQVIAGNKGWNLMTYKGFGLGWIKQLGNRLNNYLPNEFRILK